MPAKLTTERFLERAEKVHGSLYDLSLVEYKNMGTKVKIICRKHGEQSISPGNFLQGHGCPKCGIARRAEKLALSTENFVNRAKQVHGNRFDYSECSYVNSSTKISIICQIHGVFQQVPFDHLGGVGCSKCSGTAKPTTQEFIIKARSKWGNIFDYSKVQYTSAKTKVSIICPKGHEFEMTPNGHLSGQGCNHPNCSYEKLIATKQKNKTIATNLPAMTKYRQDVRRYTARSYKMFKEQINPNNLPRGYDYHLDHKFSIVDGYNNQISPEQIGHWANLIVIPAENNRSKSFKSSITLDEFMNLTSKSS